MHGFFYNSSLRSYIVLLGDLFSRVIVTREKKGELVYQKVPISNATKENFIKSLNKINNINYSGDKAKIETILPRMNINLVDMMYEPMKSTSMLNKTSAGYLEAEQYSPAPYKLIFELGIYTRYQRDMFQIVEQILPYFRPHFTTQLTELHNNEVKINRDINVVLQGVSLDESSDGAVTDRRSLEWSLMFEVTGWIYPPSVTNENQIRTIYIDFFGDTKEALDNFESIDFEVQPDGVSKDDWDGSYNESWTENTEIPTDGTIRGK